MTLPTSEDTKPIQFTDHDSIGLEDRDSCYVNHFDPFSSLTKYSAKQCRLLL